ncbi:CDP-glycerol glycerophosphotransferase family protein [Nocardioides sp. zg-536]|uniref:CDP-glycerol glycerophosphotransferase family protein n=1 Tax=Nocardioides faecalis TaxID=2803858 RepID=A0A938YAF7_9ACTN|nr:CDP-glycerol glycerophosphotransferase family protein [Nocardioides faecalis]MBM9461048.1 CDP-glycerol glycerophosphotransferase family protein [Nocardioides faecalis]QVI59133.1 CDP-glycerol glycerophosphotransferase family protein [Nocardioides faecalis]
MPLDRARAQQNLIRLAKAGPGRVRGPLGRATRRFRSEFAGPLVTVVLPVSDDETTRIGTCLDSLKVQSHRNLEVLLVRYGAHARVDEVVRAHAAADWRIKTRLKVESSLAAARNAGVAAAAGDLVIVAAGGDDFVHNGIERLLDMQQRSGSPLVVGRVRRPDIAGWVPDSPYDAAHHTPVRATTLERMPLAVTDLGLGNRMFTKELWRSCGVAFTDELPSGTDVVLGLLQGAPAFDLITSFTYIPTGRRDGVQVGAVPDVLSQLPDWIERTARTEQQVEALGDDRALQWWLWGVLDASVQPFLADVERADERQWQMLRDHVRMLLAAAEHEVWDRLSAESRVKLWLLQHDHRAALEDFLGERLFAGSQVPTETRDGVVRALLPHHDDAALDIPAELFEMTDQETRLVAMLREARWSDAGTIELSGCAAIDFVHMTAHPRLSCALVETGSGARLELEVHQHRDQRANQRRRRHQDFSWGGFTATVAAADLVAAAPAPATWALEVDIEVDGVRRTGPVTAIDDQAPAGMIGRDHLAPRPVAGARVGFRPRSESVGLQVQPDTAPRLRSLEVAGREVCGVLEPGSQVTAVRAVRGSQQVRAEVDATDGSAPTFRLVLPVAGVGARQWRLRAVLDDGTEATVGWPAVEEQWLGVGGGEVVGTRTPSGDTALLEARRTLVLDELRVEGTRLEVAGRWLGTAPAAARLELARIPAMTATATSVELPARSGEVRVGLDLTNDPWGLGARAFVPGWYWLNVVGEGLPAEAVLLGERLVDRLHQFLDGTHYSARIVHDNRAVGLDLAPAVPLEDRVPYGQERLREWHLSAEVPLDEKAVYLQSYVGASATDSQLALHHELRRTRPDLTIYWGVSSASSWVPEGGVPVLMDTAEWYRVLSTAKYLCLNIDPERWFRKRPGQRLLQTFHGYPAKSMGLRMWQAKRYSPRRLESELMRTSRQWDLILTPAPEMDEYYRREYDYDGEIHSAGYPRDDALLAPDAEQVRDDVRRRLGIRPDQKAVLYAPTWRDDKATNWRAAEAEHHLDVEVASRKLGEDYVFLMRGHRFHAPAAAATGGARFLDVTEYPEINDLILAADAAVLDYSSLRFDFALTRRPIIFLVPDLDSYVGGVRGFLYPYPPTAPGPMVDTAAEVIELLRDVDGLAERYAGELAAFHDRFNYLQDGHAAERVARAFLDTP